MKKVLNLGKVKELVSTFIDDHIDEFEFVIDLNNFDYWDINYDEKEINITECCTVFVREVEDETLNGYLNDDEFVIDKIRSNGFIFYIMM
jgi:hypothetical protein